MNEGRTTLPEPWLRGTLGEVPVVARGVLHALELAKEELWKWCGPRSSKKLAERPAGMASAAFHLRHIARSLDRLLTYAEGLKLDESQLALLRSELAPEADHDALFAELQLAFAHASRRIRALSFGDLDAPRAVGRMELPTTLGGLLVHLAEHTQRHVGQAITTARLQTAEEQ